MRDEDEYKIWETCHVPPCIYKCVGAFLVSLFLAVAEYTYTGTYSDSTYLGLTAEFPNLEIPMEMAKFCSVIPRKK